MRVDRVLVQDSTEAFGRDQAVDQEDGGFKREDVVADEEGERKRGQWREGSRLSREKKRRQPTWCSKDRVEKSPLLCNEVGEACLLKFAAKQSLREVPSSRPLSVEHTALAQSGSTA